MNIFPALLNKRFDGELPAGAPRTLWTNAESLGKEVDCDFQKSSRPKSFLGEVVAEIDTDLIRNFFAAFCLFEKALEFRKVTAWISPVAQTQTVNLSLKVGMRLCGYAAALAGWTILTW